MNYETNKNTRLQISDGIENFLEIENYTGYTNFRPNDVVLVNSNRYIIEYVHMIFADNKPILLLIVKND